MKIFNIKDARHYSSSTKNPTLKSVLATISRGEPVDADSAVDAACHIASKAEGKIDIDTILPKMGYDQPEYKLKLEELLAEIVASKVATETSSDPAITKWETEGTLDPILSLDDVERTIQDVYQSKYSFFSRDRKTLFGATDERIARMAAVCLGQSNFRTIPDKKRWLKWTGSLWDFCQEGDVRNLLQKLAEAVGEDIKEIKRCKSKEPDKVKDAVRNRTGITDSKSVDEYIEAEIAVMYKIIDSLENYNKLVAITKLMGDRVTVRYEDLDCNQDELVFSNTYWSAKTGLFYKPRRESLASRGINYDWFIPSEEARKIWKDYLEGLGFDEDTIKFMKRSFGYASLGRGTVKRFWWFRGKGNTSKTTLIQLIARCLCTYANVTKQSLWLAKGITQSGHTDEIACLRGARFVYADEFPEHSKFDDTLIKQVTSGGTPMNASFKNESGFTYKIIFSLFFSSNFDPYINEADEAALNRLTSFTFTQKIVEKKEDFIDTFLAKPFMRQAIMEWVMEGAAEYVKYGLGKEPDSVQTSRKAYKREQASLGRQLKDLFEVDLSSANALPVSEIRVIVKAYQKAIHQNIAFSDKTLNAEIKKVFKISSQKAGKGSRVYRGLRRITGDCPDEGEPPF